MEEALFVKLLWPLVVISCGLSTSNKDYDDDDETVVVVVLCWGISQRWAYEQMINNRIEVIDRLALGLAVKWWAELIMFVGSLLIEYKVTTLQTMCNSLTIPWRFPALLPTLSATHIMPVLVLLSVVGVRMQQCMIRNQREMHKLSKDKNGCKYAANNKQL